MSTLLLRLAAPLQSWGVESRFTVRDTGREPSKSGVIGLLCAALGRPRHAALEDLVALRMGVRVDREGRIAMDFHSAQNIYRASEKGTKDTEISRRYYLQDAVFLIGLEAKKIAQLEEIHQALLSPYWPLYLGRKAFIPSLSIWLKDGLKQGGLEKTLQVYPWQGNSHDLKPKHLRLVLDDHLYGSQERQDVPLSFAERRFARRRVKTGFCPCPEPLEEGL
ncbi:MAG: type I-E CRISPR-associated protein Cas5/CasD [Anaerolineales bacterium]